MAELAQKPDPADPEVPVRTGSPAAPGTLSRFELVRGTTLVVIGVIGAFVLMANEDRVVGGVWWGAIAVSAAALGLIELMGLWARDRADAIPLRESAAWRRHDGEAFWMSPQLTAPVAVLVLVGGTVTFGHEGMPWVITGSLLALAPSSLRRPGLLVFILVGLLYLPFLGWFGLWDPWETHYGEVAREVLSRDDGISLWWAHEKWFWSKPILIFWTEALSMSALGVDFRPDANPGHIEWAIRLPVVLLSLGAVMASFAAMRRVFSARAAVLGALVMATMPHFFFLAHQAITDMLLIGSMVVAMSMLILAVTRDPEHRPQAYHIGPIVVSLQTVIVFALIATVLPQVLYLITRNVTMVEPLLFAWQEDQFMLGSGGGNAGLPGHEPAQAMSSAVRADIGFVDLAQPAFQGLLWLGGLVALLVLLRNERRTAPLLMIGFYFFCALGFMGKGIPGFALPGMVALFFLIGTQRWKLLLDGHLFVGRGVLVIATVALPWYVAMWVRHGEGFFNRLFVHDHIDRLASGVHGDTGSIQYFIEQLGFATFPWMALMPLGLLLWFRYGRGREVDSERSRHQLHTTILIALWFFGGFALFSAMKTKFHHYIAPVVPPAALLVGLVLDRLFGETYESTWRGRFGALLAVLAPALLTLGIAGLWGDARGVVPDGVDAERAADWVLDHPMDARWAVAMIAIGACMLGGAGFLFGRGSRSSSMAASALAACGAVLLAFVGRDLAWVTDARPQGYERLIHLFVYNYGRPWPEQFDYRPILTGFAITATLVVALMVFRSLRPVASRALLGVALAFSVWCLDVYMVDLSPHWGQRELVKRYYELRSSPDEPLIAWQMNWKGENLYTGNRIYIFVQLDNNEIREWLGANEGKTAYFVLEHSRLANFRSLVRGHEVEELSTERENNKFILVRAQL